MKKAIKCLFLAGLALAVMTSGAWAAGAIPTTVGLNVDADGFGTGTTDLTYKMSNEQVSTTGYVSSNPGNIKNVVFVAPASATVNVTFTLANAIFSGASKGNYYLVEWKADTNADGSVEAAVAADFNASAITGTVAGNVITFTGIALTQNKAYTIINDGDGTADATSLGGVTISLPPSSSSAVTLTVGWTAGATTLSYTKTLAEFANYYKYTATALNGIIDVSADRKKFTGAALTNNLVLTQAANISANETIMAAAPLIGTEISDMTFKVVGTNQAAISSVKVGATSLTYTTDGWPYTVNTAGAPATQTIVFTVNGTTVINTATFTYSIVTTPKTGYNAITYAAAGTSAGSWSINAYQATTPYMFAGSDGTYDTFVKFSNASTSAANVFVDVTLDNGTKYSAVQLNSTNCAGLSSTGIDAGKVGTIWASEIATAAGFSADQSFAAIFTVTVAKGSVTGVCFYKRENGDRQMPLFTTSVAAADASLIQ